MRFPTVSSNPEESKKALAWVREQLNGLPVYIEEFDSNSFPSMVITTKKTKHPKVLLFAHIDVVPADGAMFEMQNENGILKGRGVLDMKFGAASFIEIFKELGDDLPQYNIGIMLTADEEIGGDDGVRYLLEEKGYRADVGFCPDGGYNWDIENSAKGVFFLTIKATGLSAHGSTPWAGINAINNLTNVLKQINAHFEKIKQNAPDASYYTTVNVGTISGGKATNQVPDSATATIDIRYIPGSNPKDILNTIKSITDEVEGVTFDVTLEAPPFLTPMSSPDVQRFIKIAKDKYNITVGSRKSHGATDARFFSKYNTPVIIVAPEGKGQHSDHEWLDLNDYMRYHNTLKEWVVETGRSAQ